MGGKVSDDPGVVAVTIATPPLTHAALVREAIAAGKHVICEKHFARDADQARDVLAAAEAAGIVHLLGTEFRFDAGQALMARAIAAGAVGEPSLASYLLHVAERGMSADDGFVVHFRLRSGLVGSLQSTSEDWGSWVVATRVCGPRGSVWIDGLSDAVFVADRSGTRQLPVPEELRAGPPEPAPADALHSAYERMIAHGMDVAPYTQLARVFLQRIRGEPTPAWARPATFSDGVAQMEVLDAIRRSAAEGGPWIGLRRQTILPGRACV